MCFCLYIHKMSDLCVAVCVAAAVTVVGVLTLSGVAVAVWDVKAVTAEVCQVCVSFS